MSTLVTILIDIIVIINKKYIWLTIKKTLKEQITR